MLEYRRKLYASCCVKVATSLKEWINRILITNP